LKSEKSIIESQKYGEQIEDANEMIALSVIKAELTYESSLQNTEMIQKEIELANDTYQMIDKQYRNNLTSIKEVLDALNDLEKANFKLQESYYNQRRAVTNLLYAKGALITNNLIKFKMKSTIKKLFSIVMTVVSSCSNEKITEYRGKVKFETPSVSSKLADALAKLYEEGQTVKRRHARLYRYPRGKCKNDAG
jgi:hypothetical protein